MDYHDRCADTTPGGAVYAVALRADGATKPLNRPITLGHAHHLIGADALDVPTVAHPWMPNEPLAMFVDDNGHDKALPVNEHATILYGSTAGWQIRGDVIVCAGALDEPLPDELVPWLLDDHTFELLYDDTDELPEVSAADAARMVEGWTDTGNRPQRPHGTGRGEDPASTGAPWPPPAATLFDPITPPRHPSPGDPPPWSPPGGPPASGLSR